MLSGFPGQLNTHGRGHVAGTKKKKKERKKKTAATERGKKTAASSAAICFRGEGTRVPISAVALTLWADSCDHQSDLFEHYRMVR